MIIGDIILFILWLAVIFLILSVFYTRYRIILGGTRCNAEVVNYKYTPSGGRGNFYTLIVVFYYKGERLRKPITAQSVSFPSRYMGKKFSIYYNDNYPEMVVRLYIWTDIFCLAIIALMVFALVTYFL